MKLNNILQAGYLPVRFNGSMIKHHSVNAKHQTLSIYFQDGGQTHFNLMLDHTEIPELELVLHVGVNQEVVEGMLLAKAGVVQIDDVIKTHIEDASHSKIDASILQSMISTWPASNGPDHNSIENRMLEHRKRNQRRQGLI